MPRITKETSKKLDKEKKQKTISKTKKETTKSTKTNSTKKTNASKSTNSKAKKEIVSKNTTKNKKTSKKSNIKQNNKINILEYYDLPYRYNQTIVKVLAQTPKTLFVYWDISDDDRNSYIKQYGMNFFENTKPVLIITNVTMNYSFEIEINDFANCWYFNINDEKCEYMVELGRRPKESNGFAISIPNNYLYITSSNKIESPNGHILFEKAQQTIFYRNLKTNEIIYKNIANLNYLTRIGRIYKINDFYHKLYKEEELAKPTKNPTSKFF